MILGLTLVAGLLAPLGGCSRPGAGEAPRAAGSIRFDISSDPATLNPLFAHPDAASVEQQLARLSFEPFVDFDARGKPVPALLSAIPTTANGGISPDGRTLTFRLRPGVRWHDGVPLSAADVLYTLHAIMDARNPVRSRAGYDAIARASAPNAHTVVFQLRHAWAPAAITLFSVGQFVLPKHVLERETSLETAAFNAQPLGDGPFHLVRWVRGERLLYEANPRYWRGRPASKALDVRIVPDPGTNLTLLRSGELEFNLIAPAQQPALHDAPLKFRYVPTVTIAGIALNVSHAPLDDVRIRRAIASSIDRAAISRTITFGRYPVVNSAQPLFSWASDSTVRLPKFDPKAADAMFDSAGWGRGPDGMRVKSGKPLALVYAQFPESQTGVRVAAFVQRELHERGVDVSIKSVSNAQLFLPQSGLLAQGKFDLAYIPWTMGADPDDSTVLSCAGAANYMRYCNREVDGLERRALAETAQPLRKQLYSRIAHIVAADVPIVYLFNADYIWAYRPALHGFSPNPFMPTWNASQWSLSPS